MNLQDTGARLPALTGVYETRDALWLTTLFGGHVGRLDNFTDSAGEEERGHVQTAPRDEP